MPGYTVSQQIYVQNSMEQLPWMDKYLWTNTRIISIICRKWWTWCLFYLRAKITGKTFTVFFDPFLASLPWMKAEHFMVSLDFGFLSSFFSRPKFELLNSRCGFSASLYGNIIWITKERVLNNSRGYSSPLPTGNDFFVWNRFPRPKLP